MSFQEKLDKIDSEIENGLKFKAADRLRNLIQENPNEIELWNKLAELYYESGFLDAAGKYWILTEPKEDRVRKCVEIYEKSVNHSGYQILQDLVFRGDKSRLSEYAQQKLLALEVDSKEKANHIPTFKPRVSKQENQEYIQSSKAKLGGFVIIGFVAAIFILIILGLITVIKWML